jgi:hypothetical protein
MGRLFAAKQQARRRISGRDLVGWMLSTSN